MKKALFLFSFALLCTNLVSAQLTLPLANGQKFTMAGVQETYQDKYNNVFYLKETADSIYYYQYNTKGLYVEETRLALQFFNQANNKANGANVKFYGAKAYANPAHFVGFKCAKDGKDMLQGFTNDFILTKYGTNNIEKTSTCLVNIYFPIGKEGEQQAKDFLKRVNERIKQLN